MRPPRNERNRFARSLNSSLVLVVVLAALGGVTGCGGGGPSVKTRMLPFTPEQAAARKKVTNARYRLRRGDLLTVMFKYEKDLNQNNVLILPDGYLSLGGVGSVKAAGLTVDELTGVLTESYARDYRNPELVVVVQSTTDPEVYVLGEVELPGLYKFTDMGVNILGAIAVAGGFRDGSQKSQVALLRETEEGYMIRLFDLSHIEKDGITDPTYLDLQPYDVVYVPRTTLGDFGYYAQALFRPMASITDFFWDIYAVANIEKIDRLVR